MKKIYLFLIGFVCLFTTSVKALDLPKIDRAVSMGDDLVLVNASQGTYKISYYLVGQSTSEAVKFTSSSLNPYVSVPNGNYNIWAVDEQGNKSQPYAVNITTSCNRTGLNNITGSGNITICGLIDYKGNLAKQKYVLKEDFHCASGYDFNPINTQMISTTCKANELKFSMYNGIEKRFCKYEYHYECVKNDTSSGAIASALASLSISSGQLSPSFASSTLNYSATTDASSITINASLKDSRASFVNGYGPRTVNLNYGKNKIEIKTKGSVISTYTLNITRTGSSSTGGNTSNLSSNNQLKSLSVDNVSLSPRFKPVTNKYSATVENNVTSVTVRAELSDTKASFVNGYGPRTVLLGEGANIIRIKVKSQSGSVRVYNVTITRKTGSGNDTETPTTPDTPTPSESKALLKSLTLDNGNIDFESSVFDYNVTVDNDVLNVIPTVVAENENDKVEINGGTELQEGANELSIKVTSEDGSTSNTYTIYIIRKSNEEEVSTSSILKDLIIKNHKLKFDAKTLEYKIALNENETELDISAEAASEKASISIEGNEKLTTGSEIKIRVTAESGDYTDYYIKITGYKKKGNVFLTILVVLIIIVIGAYAVLRALGYKIYFNFEGLKNAISNMFAKK